MIHSTVHDDDDTQLASEMNVYPTPFSPIRFVFGCIAQSNLPLLLK